MTIRADVTGLSRRIARANMITISSLLLLAPALSAGISAAVAQVTPDPIQKLTGKWDVPGTTTSILILPDHFVLHSRWGQGDIRWENAEYYVIAYRERAITCHYLVKLRSRNELSMLRYENTEPAECDLGEMRRSTPEQAEDPELDQAGHHQPRDDGRPDPQSSPTFRRPGLHPAHRSLPAPSKYYFVWDIRPPDSWLDMWEYPNSRGRHIRRMANGTPLEVLQKAAGSVSAGMWKMMSFAGFPGERLGNRI